ncbi:S49 family peptidase [Haloarcula sp. 1CSR25-25]|uniref:S49 family peptidase n=1 Tax=Haloarcula sp. 1CSR25-25 TaxID=2862545 RepID=UPI002895E702|nr:S49 family peptidase [Haloarcula sp. 1CSR25-25]MDT3433394.1 S49 family peptidase [Haloarcula sp. 1CSR25-25]
MFGREQVFSAMTASYVIAVTLALVVAAVFAPVIWNGVPSGGDDDPSVAVVTLRGGTTDANVNAVKQDLREARTNESIEAVVLRVDSPGGPVDSSEEFYLAVNRTASEMPVVAYVEGTAASGGYYGIAPADEIVVKPSSNVGSIGVIVQAPLSLIEQVEQQGETFVRSGPDKAQISKDGLREDIEVLQRSFVGTVMRHRGEQLSLSREEVSNGNTYLGAQATENGFADRIGDSELAIERAAALSNDIQGDRYDVAYLGSGGAEFNVIIVPAGAETVQGANNVTYLVHPDDSETTFREPVKYYAVWGIPAEDNNATVIRND